MGNKIIDIFPEAKRVANDKERTDEIVYSSTGLQENTASVVCYLGTFFTGMIFLVFEENSKLVRFHAMQSTLLFFCILIVAAIFNYVPYGWIVNSTVAIIGLALWVFLMTKGYKKERYHLPYFGQLSESLLQKLDRKKKRF